jgi:intracellular sulfur oxidation DsrE/DsrF family protein
VIKDSGAVWNLDQLDFSTNTDKTYRAVFDIMDSPESPEKKNSSIETVARFLNMHAQQGVPVSNLKAAMVVHNKASKDLLQDEYYLQRYGVYNPNTRMLNELMEAGVSVIFCGQSSVARNVPRDQILEGVQTALSAMTALISLQDEGYRLIKF